MLSADNQDWVNSQIDSRIQKAIKDLKPPSGFRRAVFLLREWGVLAANITIIVTLLIFAFSQWTAANARLAAEATFRTHTEDRLIDIEKSLTKMQVVSASKSPAQPASQTEAREALASARKADIRLPLATIRDAGESFLLASKSTPSAWSTALDCVAYRSYLNRSTN